MLLERTVICFVCKDAVPERENASREERRPCVQCGSLERAVQIVTAGYIRSLDDLRLDFTHTPIAASTEGPDQLVIVQREFVPDHDLYTESVEDEATGEVLWRMESRLQDQRNKAMS